jgi:hypothetical protein
MRNKLTIPLINLFVPLKTQEEDSTVNPLKIHTYGGGEYTMFSARTLGIISLLAVGAHIRKQPYQSPPVPPTISLPLSILYLCALQNRKHKKTVAIPYQQCED